MRYLFSAKSEEDTSLFAYKLASKLKPGDIILLDGVLGSGKTFFAKGLGKGLGIKDTVISPTFNIVRCYFDGSLPMYHIDAYRLEDANHDIGLDEYLEGDGVCLVEWPIFIKKILPDEYLEVQITITGEKSRDYLFISHGERYDALLEELTNE